LCSKNEPLVDEVEVVDVNPTYARVRYPGGREVTVSLRDLAPRPQLCELSSLVRLTKIRVPGVILETFQ